MFILPANGLRKEKLKGKKKKQKTEAVTPFPFKIYTQIYFISERH